MPTPIIESIALNIVSTMETITAANGYDNTVASVIRKTRNPPAVTDLLLIVLEDDAIALPGETLSKRTWSQAFVVVAYVVESESSTVAYETRINSIWADIQKALMVDRQRNGKAINTEITSVQLFSDNDDGDGVAVEFAVTYRTDVENPYSL